MTLRERAVWFARLFGVAVLVVAVALGFFLFVGIAPPAPHRKPPTHKGSSFPISPMPQVPGLGQFME